MTSRSQSSLIPVLCYQHVEWRNEKGESSRADGFWLSQAIETGEKLVGRFSDCAKTQPVPGHRWNTSSTPGGETVLYVDSSFTFTVMLIYMLQLQEDQKPLSPLLKADDFLNIWNDFLNLYTSQLSDVLLESKAFLMWCQGVNVAQRRVHLCIHKRQWVALCAPSISPSLQ